MSQGETSGQGDIIPIYSFPYLSKAHIISRVSSFFNLPPSLAEEIGEQLQGRARSWTAFVMFVATIPSVGVKGLSELNKLVKEEESRLSKQRKD